MTTAAKHDPKGFNRRVVNWIDDKYDGNVSKAARESGVPRNTLWQIYRGLTRTPAAPVLISLANAMGVTIDFLITGEV